MLLTLLALAVAAPTGAPASPAPRETPSPRPSPVVTLSPAPRVTSTPSAPAVPAASVAPAVPSDGGPNYDTTLHYIVAHVAATFHTSEVRAGSSPRVRYRMDYAAAYAFVPGTRCDLDVTNTFVEAITDTSEPARSLDDVPELYALDDGSAHNVYSPAFSDGTYARRESADRIGGANRNTYTWKYTFAYHFGGVDLSRLRLVRVTDPEQREMFSPFVVTDYETGQRVMRAVTRAAHLCGARDDDPFSATVPQADPFAKPR